MYTVPFCVFRKRKRMDKRAELLLIFLGMILALASCGAIESEKKDSIDTLPAEQEVTDTMERNPIYEEPTGAPVEATIENDATYNVTEGTEEYRGFILDNVLHSDAEGDIHYNLYVPETYDGSTPYALFMTLPGYQGLYFQGVGENIRTEEFGFVAQEYNPEMIIVAPQLEDWGERSARQTIALTEYFLDAYNIDTTKVYAEGYSGGGETLSLVMGMRPELYTAYLQCSSQWDGGYDAVVESRTPVYLVVGERDEYYGSLPSENAYDAIHELYEKQGLTDSEIDKLLVLDIKTTPYFSKQGVTNQHGGGGHLFVQDEEIMGWLFGQQRGETE